MSYLLDTDVVVDYLRGRKNIVNKLIELSSEDLYISVINLAELFYGVYNSDKLSKHIKILSDFLADVEVLNIDLEVCKLFGKLKAALRVKGKMIR